MAPKIITNVRVDKPMCCCCIHVRIGTIFIGICNLVSHVIGMLYIMTFMASPDTVRMDVQYVSSISDKQWKTGPIVGHADNLPNDDTATGNYIAYPTDWYQVENNSFNNENSKPLALLILILMFFITSMLVYGAAKFRPGYLMPFFCLQLFDFFLSSLTVIGFFTYKLDITEGVSNNSIIPMQDDILEFFKAHNLTTEQFYMICLGLLLLMLTLKAYCIGCVWTCYKYIIARNVARAVEPVSDSDGDIHVSLPPKYSDIVMESDYLPVYSP